MPRQHQYRIVRRGFAAAVALLALAVTPAAASTVLRVESAEKIVAFGDVHGAYDELVSLLESAGLLDERLAWRGGKSHLVSVGDLLDRGSDSRKVLDLLMRLEQEAAAAGGAVHVIAGNHEVMNLLGDLRYTAPGEFAAFAAEEDPGRRTRGFEAFLALPENAGLPTEQIEQKFATRFPPGWFAHRDAYSRHGRYGQWLLARPALLTIGDTAFVHGGLPPVVAGTDLEEVNARYRALVSEYLAGLEVLETRGVLDPYLDFFERPKRVTAWLETPAPERERDPELETAARRFLEADRAQMLGLDGPLWYRGQALCHIATEETNLDAALAALGVSRVVIGHTPTPTARILSRFDGRVIRVDTGLNYAVYQGRRSALVIAGGELSAFYAETPTEPTLLDPQPGYAGYARLGLDEAQVLDVLANGAIVATEPRGPDDLGLTLDAGGKRVSAVFVRDTAARIEREIAAWRLDRLLDLGLVPPTVARKVDGKTGFVQLRLPGVESYAALQTAERPLATGWCPMEPQNQLMYAFDVLTLNEMRTPESVLYDTEDWMLMSTGHAAGFGTAQRLPRHLTTVPLAPPAALLERVVHLTPQALEAGFEGLLSKREIRAIIERGRLLQAAADSAPKRP